MNAQGIKITVELPELPEGAQIENHLGEQLFPIRRGGGGVWVQDFSQYAEGGGWTYYRGKDSI